MKNYKLTILLFLLTLGISNAQTVGDHLNYIKEKKPGGVLKTTSTPGIYFYTYIDDHSIWSYVLDENLICRDILMSPKDSSDVTSIVKALRNQNYLQLDDTHWKYYRDDGSIITVELTYSKDVGPVFTITQAN